MGCSPPPQLSRSLSVQRKPKSRWTKPDRTLALKQSDSRESHTCVSELTQHHCALSYQNTIRTFPYILDQLLYSCYYVRERVLASTAGHGSCWLWHRQCSLTPRKRASLFWRWDSAWEQSWSSHDATTHKPQRSVLLQAVQWSAEPH